MASSPDRVKPKTIKLVFVASPLVKHHQGLRAKTGGFGNKYLKSHNYQEMLDCFALYEETTMTLHQERKV